jgi:hypothetical protein
MRHLALPIILLALPLPAQAVYVHTQVPLIFGLGDFHERPALRADGQRSQVTEGYGWGYGLGIYFSRTRNARLSTYQGFLSTQASDEHGNPEPGGPRERYGHFQVSYGAGCHLFPGGGAESRRGLYLLGGLEAGLEVYSLRHGEWGDIQKKTTRFRPGLQVGLGREWSDRSGVRWSLELVYHPSFTAKSMGGRELPRSNFAALTLGFTVPRHYPARS